jgi:hypothetical protein
LHNPLAVMGILSAAHVLLGDSPVAPPRPAGAPWLRSNSRPR